MSIRRSIGNPAAWCCGLLFLGGCAVVPPLPEEDDVPVKEIVNDAVCQTRQALEEIRTLKIPQSSFDPEKWDIGITLTPKATFQYDASLVGSGKSNPAPKKTLASIVGALASVGGIPAADYDSAAYTQGSASYLIHSNSFFSKNGPSPIVALCTNREQPVRRYDVTRNLDIDKWLMRVISPVDSQIVSLGSSAPSGTTFSYSVDLIIYEAAGATLSYAVPSGRWLTGLGLGVKRTQEVTLTINLNSDTGVTRSVVSKSGKVVSKTVPSAEGVRAFQLQQLLLNPSTTLTR